MWSTILPSLVGFLGVLVGAFMVRGNERGRRRLDFIEKQLRDLYSPLHSIRQEIRALSELRVRIEGASDEAWRQLCADRNGTCATATLPSSSRMVQGSVAAPPAPSALLGKAAADSAKRQADLDAKALGLRSRQRCLPAPTR